VLALILSLAFFDHRVPPWTIIYQRHHYRSAGLVAVVPANPSTVIANLWPVHLA
jgi:hypothetical protein